MEVLRQVDLQIADGEFLVLVGPSGCGKTTLLRLLAGLEAPTGGEIFVGDRCVTGLRPAQRDVAMVFQSYALYPHLNVADNIGFGNTGIGNVGFGKKKDMPGGLWIKCESCGAMLFRKDFEQKNRVCGTCGYHFTLPARERIAITVEHYSLPKITSTLGIRKLTVS